MRITKRILCAALALICCFGALFIMSACDEEQGSTNGGIYYVEYKNVKIELDKDAKTVLESLGKAKYEDNLGDCGGIGVQIKYTYGDIAINTLKENDGEKIHKISFMNDLVSTPKGIYIGSTEQAVIDAYGAATSTENGRLTYKSGDLELEFSVKEGKVSGINYRRIR